jgi:hypothetical protein
MSGTITYAPPDSGNPFPNKPLHPAGTHIAKAQPAIQEPLTGNITIQGFALSGNGLSQPIRIPRLVFEPAPASASQPSAASMAFVSTVAIPAGAPVPLTVSTRLAFSGYQLMLRGQASIIRAKELAHVADFANVSALDALAGEPITVDLTAEGPWMPTQPLVQPPALMPIQPLVQPAVHSAQPVVPSIDTLTGTVTLRNANWKPVYLANAIQISHATLHLAAGEFLWDPVVFSYGPVKGTATLSLPTACDASQPCLPHFQLQFGALDASLLQAAFLGAQEKGTLLSTLINRLRSTAAPAWPRLDGTVKAESLILGPVTLNTPSATLSTLADGASITAFDAGLLGGRVHGSGTYQAAASAKDKPSYQFEGQLEKLSPVAVGKLLGLRSYGTSFDGNGKIELTGFTGDDLAASAKGSLHIEWQHGAITASSPIPPELVLFDRWIADAELANGSITLKENQLKRGAHSTSIQAAVPLADPPRLTFPALKEAPVKR